MDLSSRVAASSCQVAQIVSEEVELGEACPIPLPALAWKLCLSARHLRPALVLAIFLYLLANSTQQSCLFADIFQLPLRHVSPARHRPLQGVRRHSLPKMSQERALQLRMQGYGTRATIPIAPITDTAAPQPQAKAKAHDRGARRPSAQEWRCR